MRVVVAVGMLMVSTMGADPFDRRIFKAADAEVDEAAFHPLLCDETAVTEQPVVTDVDPHPEDVDADECDHQPRPTEKPRDEFGQGAQMHHREGDDVGPTKPVANNACR